MKRAGMLRLMGAAATAPIVAPLAKVVPVRAALVEEGCWSAVSISSGQASFDRIVYGMRGLAEALEALGATARKAGAALGRMNVFVNGIDEGTILP
jgi:hypothetical protein